MTSRKVVRFDSVVSPVGSFVLHERDLLQISATVSVSLFLQAPLGQLLGRLLRKHGGRKIRTLSEMLHPCIWGKLVIEFGVLLAIVILTIEETFHSNIRPFTHDPLHAPSPCLRLIYGIAIGRFFVVIGNILSAYDVITQSGNRIMKIRSLTGHSGKPSVDIAYCATSIVSNIISLAFGENHLLVLTSSFMELNCVHLAFRRLAELVNQRIRPRTSLKSSIFCSAIFCITRIVLPILFLGLAVSRESPLLMSIIPLIWFAFCCFFYSIYHMYLLYHCTRQLFHALSTTTSLPPSPSIQELRNDFATCLSNNSSMCAIPYSFDFFTNDLRSNIDTIKNTEQCQGSKEWHEKSSIEAKIGLNYGFLHCYDNRNLFSSRISGMSEKVNIGLKKSTGKEKLSSYWSDHVIDPSYKTPDQMVSCRLQDRKRETGSLLSYAGAVTSEGISEDDIADNALRHCTSTSGCDMTLCTKREDDSSSNWGEGVHRNSPFLHKIVRSMSLTITRDSSNDEVE